MNKVYFFVIVMTFTLFGCAVSTDQSISIGSPITSVDEKVKEGDEEGGNGRTKAYIEAPNTIAVMPFFNGTEERQAADVLRTIVASHLSSLSMAVMHNAEVDAKLPGGYALIENQATFLGVDAVLVGEVTKYERLFAGIYAQIQMGVKLKLVNTKNEVIWETEQVVTSRAGGVSLTPWGLLLNAAIAAMHLDDENLFAAADELSRKIARIIPKPASYQLSGPLIENVIHDSADKWLKYADKMQVGLRGEPNAHASIEVGNLAVVELQESEPGVYLGTVDIDNNWNIEGLMLTGKLRNSSGAISKKISSVGLVNIDNIPPLKVKGVILNAVAQRLKGRWDKLEDADLYRVILVDGDQQVTLVETEENNFNIAFASDLFEQSDIRIHVLDKSQNASDAVREKVTMYPREIRHNEIQTGPLSGDYHGTILLSSQFSPYQINNAVTFTENSQLIVEPGVELRFAQGASIEITGESFFWGNITPITITQSNESTMAQRFLIINSAKAVELTGVHFDRGGQAMVVLSGEPVLENVTFTNSKFSALDISGESKVTLKYCLIEGSNTSGIVISGHARASIEQSEFRDNQPFHIQSSSVYEIEAQNNNWLPMASAQTILGNVRY